MTVLYYPHIFGETIYDCMENAQEFDTIHELIKWLAEQHKIWIDKAEIVLGDEIFDDDRVGVKESRMILFKRFGNTVFDEPQCWGYCALKYEPGQIERSKLEVKDMIGTLTPEEFKKLKALQSKYGYP